MSIEIIKNDVKKLDAAIRKHTAACRTGRTLYTYDKNHNIIYVNTRR